MNETIKKGLKDYQSKMLIGARAEGDATPPKPGIIEDILLRDFHTITATSYLFKSWQGPYSYNFDDFNAWVNWAQAHQLPLVMHLLGGPNTYYPAWAKEAKWEGPDLLHLYYEYLRNLMTINDNGRKVAVWNVTNEFLNEITGHYHPADFCLVQQAGWEKDESGLTGEDRINEMHPRIFSFLYETAARFAEGKLELREDNFEFEPDGRKAKAMRQQILHLRNKGCRVDAVGFQCHLYWSDRIDYTRLDLFQRNVEQFHQMGLEVYVTELDNPVLSDGVEGQSKRWEEFYRACLACGVEQVHTWGVLDGVDRAWRDGTHPLLFDEVGQAKDGYFAVARALRESM